MDEAKEQVVDLTAQLEQAQQAHQVAAEKADQLQRDVEAQQELTEGLETQLATEKAERRADQEAHKVVLDKRDEDFEKSVKSGVIDALAEQGREPIELCAKPSKEIYNADDVIAMTPNDRANVMRKVREGKAEITD